MCETDDFEEFARHGNPLTRRTFCLMTLSAGLVAALPGLAGTVETPMRTSCILRRAGTRVC
jgi:hypothetical protein